MTLLAVTMWLSMILSAWLYSRDRRAQESTAIKIIREVRLMIPSPIIVASKEEEEAKVEK